MGYRMEVWCDECQKKMGRSEVQWPALRENGWRYFDFCGYSCANTFRNRMLAAADSPSPPNPTRSGGGEG